MAKKSTLIKKLASYSALTSAAMVAAKTSEGQIIYTNLIPDDTTYLNNSYLLDLNNDGISDFEFNVQYAGSGNQVRVIGYSSNSITRDLITHVGTWQGYAYADTVLNGAPIGAGNLFFSKMILASHYSFNDFGNFSGVVDHFMGVKIKKNSSTYYGWIRISIPSSCDYLVVNDYAMDTIANESINAGDKCGNYSALVNTVVNGPDPLGFCEGNTATLQTDSLSGGSYQWFLNGNMINDETQNSITVDSAGNYSVMVTNSYGCVDTSSEATVIAFPPAVIPVISQTGDVLTSSVSSSYQWSYNGNEIAGATDQNYETTQGGNYTVTITDENGCTAESEPYVFIPVGTPSLPGNSVSVFELNNFLFVHLHDKNFLNGALKIFDAVGNQVRDLVISNENLEIDLNQLAAGIYFVAIEKDGLSFNRKIVIQ